MIDNFQERIATWEQIELNYYVHWYEFLLVAVWTTLFIYWSYALLRKRDL